MPARLHPSLARSNSWQFVLPSLPICIPRTLCVVCVSRKRLWDNGKRKKEKVGMLQWHTMGDRLKTMFLLLRRGKRKRLEENAFLVHAC